MNEILKQSLLFDFYGELLTANQRHVYEQHILEDMSLSEVALDQGVSRQSIHDLIRRTQQKLDAYEQKLHLVEKFLSIKDRVEVLEQALFHYETGDVEEATFLGQMKEGFHQITQDL